MGDPISEGFLGFSARSFMANNMRSKARYLNPLASYPVKKYSPLILNASGRLEHAAVQGTNEVTTLTQTGSPTGGTFTITYGGQTTAGIAYNATAAQVQTALQALSTIGNGNVVCAGGPINSAAVTVTWSNALSGTDITAPTCTSTGLTGGTSPAVTPTTTTAGVVGYVTSTKLVGFSDEWEEGPLGTQYGREFAQAPKELGLPFSGAVAGQTTPNREIIYFPCLAGNVFSGAIEPTVAVSEALLASGGVTADLGWDPGNKRCYIRTATTNNALIKIIGIRPDSIGVYGGVVDFKILDGKSQVES